MGSLQTTHYWTKELSLIKARGKLKVRDFLDWFEVYFSGRVTPLIIWDFREADLSGLTGFQAGKIAMESKRRNKVRPGGKSALVFSKDLDFGIGRMLEAFSEIEESLVEYRSFRNINQAWDWLAIKPFPAFAPGIKEMKKMNDQQTPETGECRRCGSCCGNGGPTLHKEDLHLLRGEHIAHHHLITIRTGEPAYDPLVERTRPVEQELVKIAGRNSTWTCLFYVDETSTCSIYRYRPLECRLLKCWDPGELKEIIGKNNMVRKDLINPSDPILDLMSAQEEQCDYGRINHLVRQLKDGAKERDHLDELTDIVRKDLIIRAYAQQQFSVSLPMELFLFGRPVFKILAAYGFQLQEKNQEVFLHPPAGL